MKNFIKILGVGFLIGGLYYFINIIDRGGSTTNIFSLLLRFLNAVVWIIGGYGLLRLKRWSLYAVGSMIGLYILTTIYNLYLTSLPKSQINLYVPALHIMFFLFLYTYKDKLFKK